MATFLPGVLDVAQLPTPGQRRRTNVLVVSSVALSFISFWRAAAIVLCDLASSAYYVGGISEQAVGKAAPWFILAIMLFSYAVRAVYVESCTMFTRGGVYRVVKEAMGGSLAKLSVSALMFDYILTGPISGVSAGQYLVGLFNDLMVLFTRYLSHGKHVFHFSAQYPHMVPILSMLIAIGITLYFWRANIIGIGESSDKALKIMKFTTVMGVLIIGWSLLTLAKRHQVTQMPPFHPVFTAESTGWLYGLPRLVGAFGVLIAFGHALLAMSGEESLAQVNREIEAPKLKNLLRAGFVIFMYSLLLTSLISFFAVLIIPDGKRVATYIVPEGQSYDSTTPQVDYLRKGDSVGQSWGYRITDTDSDFPKVSQEKVVVGPGTGKAVVRDDGGYRDNLINGLVHYLLGPDWLKIIMQAFVVIVGFLILAGAVNTSLVGSNGVMNRLAEDGVLTPWFLHPQAKYGTTHRLINLLAILQLLTIVYSWGDVDTLGEAYAFGVVWSFVFKTLAMVVLRFKDKSPRHYEVPLNIRIRLGIEPQLAGPSGTAAQLPALEPQPGGAIAHMDVPPSQSVPADGEAPKPAMAPNDAASPQTVKHLDLPIGIIIIFLVLLSTAAMNLLTKKTATEWGIGFTAVFLLAFVILEQIAHRRLHGAHHEHLEQFNEQNSSTISAQALGLRYPNPILVAARGPRSLPVLERILKEIDTDQRDVVVVTCKVLPPMTQGVTEHETRVNDEDRALLTRIVTVAEEIGKEVHPLVLPTNNPLYAICTAARDIKATEVVLGVSEKILADEQLEQFALAWGSATADHEGATTKMTVRIVGPQVEMKYDME